MIAKAHRMGVSRKDMMHRFLVFNIIKLIKWDYAPPNRQGAIG